MELWNASLPQCIDGASHIKALGIRRVGITDPPYPWAHVIACEPLDRPGLGVSPHLRFKARHPCGLTFVWSMNIVAQSQSDGDEWRFSPECERMMAELPEQHRVTVRMFAATFAQAIRDEVQRYHRSREDTLGVADRLDAFAKQ